MVKKLICSIIVMMVVGANFTATAFSGGNGTLASPYKIATASDFQEIQDNSTAYYVLVDDIIDISPLSTTFKGHLDGQGYSLSINCEYTNTTRGKYQLGGLFRNCIGAEISNVIVKGTINVKATYYSGEYKNYYWCQNKWSGFRDDVEVYLKEVEIGGICANAKSSVFSNCRIECNIAWNPISENLSTNSRYTYELLSNNSSIGGIVGYASDCDFFSSSVVGKINVRFINETASYWRWEYSNYGYVATQASNNKCGGILGYGDNCKIKNSLFTGILLTEGGSYYGVGGTTMLGGFVGYSNNSTIQCSYYGGKFLDNENRRKFGYISGDGYVNADQCLAICDKNNELMFASSGSFSQCYTTQKSDASYTDEGLVDIMLLSLQSWYAENLPDWDFVNVWYIPAVENGLPLLSVEPKIYYEGEFNYGGSVCFNSQNIHKGVIIETNNPDDVDITNNSVRFLKAGEVILTLRQDAYGEYRKVRKELSFNVAKHDLNISIEPSESIYGDELPEFKLKYEGFILDDDASSINSLPKFFCDASPTHNIGEYPIILQGGVADNYNILCSNGIHTILPRTLTATPQDCTRKYGLNNPTFHVIFDGFVNGDNENIVITQPNVLTTADKYSDTGLYSILCNGGSVSNNYKLKYGVGTLSIEKANLSIMAMDVKREAGCPNPKFELNFDGFRNNDGILDLDELPQISCEANMSSEPGVYPIILSGGYDNNYEYNLKNGQLIVEDCSEVTILVQSISVNPANWNESLGEFFQISATVLPENATDKTLVWSSSDSEIATVDAAGNVHILKDGYCTITVSTQDGSNLSAECVITSVSGIDAIFKDANASFDVYTLQGILIKEGCRRNDLKKLPTGAYILCQGNVRKKIMIR